MIRAADLIEKFKYAVEVKGGYIWGKSGQVWTQQDQNNTSNEQAIKYGSKWIGHQVWDCSGLFRWAYKQLGTDCAHGSNSIYNRYCKDKGRLRNGKKHATNEELKPGTAVFTGVEEDHGHIGLYIGGGEVIEAKGTAYGVVTGKVTDSKWTFWGELTAVQYEKGGGGEVPEEPKKQTLKRGDKGEDVKELQKELINLGYPLPRYGADGDFGKETEAAVKAFQGDNGLKADGVVGEKTWTALEKANPMQLFTVIIPGLMKHEAEALVKSYPGASMKEE